MLFKKRNGNGKEKVTYQRISPNEVKIIYEEGHIRNEVVARVVTRGSYDPWDVKKTREEKAATE